MIIVSEEVVYDQHGLHRRDRHAVQVRRYTKCLMASRYCRIVVSYERRTCWEVVFVLTVELRCLGPFRGRVELYELSRGCIDDKMQGDNCGVMFTFLFVWQGPEVFILLQKARTVDNRIYRIDDLKILCNKAVYRSEISRDHRNKAYMLACSFEGSTRMTSSSPPYVISIPYLVVAVKLTLQVQ